MHYLNVTLNAKCSIWTSPNDALATWKVVQPIEICWPPPRADPNGTASGSVIKAELRTWPFRRKGMNSCRPSEARGVTSCPRLKLSKVEKKKSLPRLKKGRLVGLKKGPLGLKKSLLALKKSFPGLTKVFRLKKSVPRKTSLTKNMMRTKGMRRTTLHGVEGGEEFWKGFSRTVGFQDVGWSLPKWYLERILIGSCHMSDVFLGPSFAKPSGFFATCVNRKAFRKMFSKIRPR